MEEDAPPTVAEFVEYCEVQAGLLSGHVETMRAEADTLLDEIDEELATARDRLQGQLGTDHTERPQSTDGPTGEAFDADVVAALEEKQSLVEAKQARMRAFQSLAAGYVELAEALDAEITDAETALERVVAFEGENDAPLYFDDRETLYESVAAGAADER